MAPQAKGIAMKRSRLASMIAAPLTAYVMFFGAMLSAPAAFAQSADIAGMPDPLIQRLQSRVETLESANRRLTGDIESLQQQNQTLRTENEQMRSISDELNARVVQVEQALRMQAALGFGDTSALPPPAPKPGAAAAPAATSAPATTGGAAPSSLGAPSSAGAPAQLSPSTQLLREGQYKLSGGDIEGARTTLRSLVAQYPKSADATEAKFWIGETQYLEGDYPTAAQTYVNILKSAPKAPRAPDAMVRLGSTLGKMGSKTDGCTTLGQVLVQYPKASAQTKARLKSEQASLGCKV
jgi:tol-pal system protein YbgF